MLGREPRLEHNSREAMRNAWIGGVHPGRRLERSNRLLVLVDRALQQSLPLPQTCGGALRERQRNRSKPPLLFALVQRAAGKLGKDIGIGGALPRFIQCGREAHKSPTPHSLEISAATASRSIALRSGCHMSKMKTTRNSSV